MALSVTTEVHGKQTVYVLKDGESGASASVLPSYGFNLFDLRLPVGRKVVPILKSADDFAESPAHAAGNGIPVLFPYPNRVALGKFSFGGKAYDLPIRNGPNAIHGFAHEAPWDVVSQGVEGDEAAITGRFQLSKNAPEMSAHWPADAVLQIRYGLSGRALTLKATVSNPSGDDLPYGLGFHPYFRLPFDPKGPLEATRVIVPASEYWPLEGFLPTGEKKPVGDRLDFRQGQSMKGLKLDDVLTGLNYDEKGHCVCRLQDLTLAAEFRMTVDKNIRELVLYTPPGAGNVISVEPYTQTTDAINLAARKVDGGLRVLKHGAQDSLTIVMETLG